MGDETIAIGNYEDDCVGGFDDFEMPFGLQNNVPPSMEEVRGETSTASMTWTNEPETEPEQKAEMSILERI